VVPHIVIAVCLFVSVIAAEVQSPIVSMGEFSARRAATRKVTPAYPAASVARKSAGVAVASFTSDPSGKVQSVTILEAPDEAIAAAVREAVEAWEFSPITVMGESGPSGLRGKLTFYFRVNGNKGMVANPEDMPGGPKPEPPGGPPAGAPGRRSGLPAAPPAVIGGHRSSATEIGEADLAKLTATSKPTILDVRERADFKRRHREGAISIPDDELSVRGWIEIDRTRPVVIDCSDLETMRCHNAADRLMGGPKPIGVFILIP
jgi:TonB family protein